jgi:hypothetical protein
MENGKSLWKIGGSGGKFFGLEKLDSVKIC